eukprot:36994-Alexandrium_andersonii.AAC.1
MHCTMHHAHSVRRTGVAKCTGPGRPRPLCATQGAASPATPCTLYTVHRPLGASRRGGPSHP